MELTILGVYLDGGAQILHLLFSITVGNYNPDWRLFGCHGEIPPEGLPKITKIPVAFFGVGRAVSATYWEDHQEYLEGSPPSGWQTLTYKRASVKGEGRNLSCRGITFLPPDAATPIFHMEGSVIKFSNKKHLFILYIKCSSKWHRWPSSSHGWTAELTSSYVATISIFSVFSVVSSVKIQYVSPCSPKPLFMKTHTKSHDRKSPFRLSRPT